MQKAGQRKKDVLSLFQERKKSLPASPFRLKTCSPYAIQKSNIDRWRICIVTPDLMGPVRNGGIGTSCTYLSQELAEAGHRVSILFTQGNSSAKATDAWVEPYARQGIHITVACEWAKTRRFPPVFPEYPPLLMAHIVHDWLAERHFDVVIFMEWQGNGYYALRSRECGLRFQDTVFITHMHSPSLWHAVYNAELPEHPLQALTWFMERQSLALADAVISPSAFMIEWAQKHGYRLPALTCVQPNLFEVELSSSSKRVGRSHIGELVFFGRLEYRKGLVEFCDALDLLVREATLPKQVTFLGKFARVGQEHAALYLARRARAWPIPVTFITCADHKEALKYLAEGERLAVMPSVADNSPYTVYECLAGGIPFIARNTGGVAELIDPADRESCLCSDNPHSLAEKLAVALERGMRCPKLAFDLEENRRAWKERFCSLVRSARQQRSSSSPVSELPTISVCLTHYSRPQLLRQALQSLLAQDYPHFEVILADDGSFDAPSQALLDSLEPEFRKRRWTMLRLENGYLGKARNAAAQKASGAFLLFLDDDNVARPCMLSRFAQAAAASGADIVTAMFDVFAGNRMPGSRTPVRERFLPVGGILSYSAITNVIGDANALVRRELFLSLGGFSEDYGLGHEDFEFFLRALLKGCHFAVIPESLFWYRRDAPSMLGTTNTAANRMRSLRPFIDSLAPDWAEMVMMTHTLALRELAVKERCACAPPHLSPEAKRLFAYRDPNAPEVLLDVADALILSKQEAMGLQILHQMETSEKSSSATRQAGTLLRAKAYEKIAAGDWESLGDLAKQADSQRLPVRADFYISVLEALLRVTLYGDEPASLRTIFCQRLLALPNPDERSWLTAAEFYLQDQQPEEAVPLLESALRRTEQIYLEQRPDVAKAVRDGIFTSGLHHYALHGRSEGTPWPKAASFIPLFQHYKHFFLDNPEKPQSKLLRYAVQTFLSPSVLPAA